MDQISLCSIILLMILFLMSNVCSNVDFFLSDGSYCDGTDWVPYKDEKCYKIIKKWSTRKESKEICNQELSQADSSIPQLVSIKSAAEQEFLTKLIFDTEQVKINVWIGAKRRLFGSNDFVWDDDSDIEYSNWVEGGPTEEEEAACVVMLSKLVKENEKFSNMNGKWKNVFCGQPNYVICEKLPRWSIVKLQETLLGQRKELDETKGKLANTENELNNLKQNSIPLGFIYVQLPNEKSPTEIWSWMSWTDVSDSYGGVFFRVNGGSSAPFGAIQTENSPRLVRMETFLSDTLQNLNQNLTLNEYVVGQDTTPSAAIHTGDFPLNNHLMLRFVKSEGEVRPRNMAIRVWKRTG